MCKTDNGIFGGDGDGGSVFRLISVFCAFKFRLKETMIGQKEWRANERETNDIAEKPCPPKKTSCRKNADRVFPPKNIPSFFSVISFANSDL